jgi:Endonuclease/Exonuclease/phosphatase family
LIKKREHLLIPRGSTSITAWALGNKKRHATPGMALFASGGPVWQGWPLGHIRHSWTIWMRIATYNVNGVNGRLANLLGWLEEAAPNVVCLQELKAPDEKFPETANRRCRLRRDLAWAKKLERRSDSGARRRADGNPSGFAGRSRRHAQPLHRSGD